MKILFITDFLLAEEQGAKQCAKAHYQTLIEMFGQDEVDVAALNSTYRDMTGHIVYWERKRSKADKLISILRGAPFLISKKGTDEIIKLCKGNRYDCVFVDHSIYGRIIKRIKTETQIPVISFFHGIMRYQCMEYRKHNDTSVFYFMPEMNTRRNETETVRYSDMCLVLNGRDDDNFEKYYGRRADGYLPLCYVDDAKIAMAEKEDCFKLLFVGGYFWPNVHGITWFVENVMPALPEDVSLDIVGNNMERVADMLGGRRVRVHGRVECLDDFYNQADVVVGPIFEGEGMKSKTCEALMYGKLYLGTDEALEGYTGLDHLRCNTAKEFTDCILKIRNSQGPKYHEEMREIYLERYSPQMARNRLTEIMRKLGVLK